MGAFAVPCRCLRALLLAVVPAVFWLLAADARAGTYTVSSCRSGWTPDVQRSGDPSSVHAYDFCDIERGLHASFY
jgi:hypothetical protein